MVFTTTYGTKLPRSTHNVTLNVVRTVLNVVRTVESNVRLIEPPIVINVSPNHGVPHLKHTPRAKTAHLMRGKQPKATHLKAGDHTGTHQPG